MGLAQIFPELLADTDQITCRWSANILRFALEFHLICKFGVAPVEVTEVRVAQSGTSAATPSSYKWFTLLLQLKMFG